LIDIVLQTERENMMNQKLIADPRERPVKPVTATRTFMISGLGTALEYYDFLIYGFSAAIVFNRVFFPDSDPLVGTLLAFAAFGTGFIARPLGGVVIGHFGDRIGRKKMLVLTLVMMGAATFLIGCLPDHSQIGMLAPVLLVVLRLIQGFAAGGEWGGAALFGIESSPQNRRGLWGSFTSMGIGLGGLIGSLVFAIVSLAAGDDLISFAWRIPFWLGGLLVIVGLFARLSMAEEERPAASAEKRPPLIQALRHSPKKVLLTLGISYAYNTIAYMGTTFFLTYMVQLGYGSTESLTFQLITAATIVVSAPLFGLLSDRIGRRPVLVMGGVAMSGLLFAFFPAVGLGNTLLAVAAFALTGIIMAMTQGPIPAFFGEQFPKGMRYSGISLSYQMGAAIGGGTASVVATALLIAFDGNAVSVAAYGTLAMVVLIACTLALKETHRLTADEINNAE
jgi:MFS family permease